MLYVLRHVLSVLLLPAMVAIVVPIWIAREWHVPARWPASSTGWLALTAGLLAEALGLLLFASSLRRFAGEGRGTLAPWDPPRRLVIHGPYRYVRNPMISGVIFMLAGIALTLRSWPHAAWAATFAGANLLLIPLIEEPMLEMRFGDRYRAYAREVPRFVPRLRPWLEAGESASTRRGR